MTGGYYLPFGLQPVLQVKSVLSPALFVYSEGAATDLLLTVIERFRCAGFHRRNRDLLIHYEGSLASIVFLRQVKLGGFHTITLLERG
jgi:hypothetical protein